VRLSEASDEADCESPWDPAPLDEEARQDARDFAPRERADHRGLTPHDLKQIDTWADRAAALYLQGLPILEAWGQANDEESGVEMAPVLGES
jgi:hypothetical protein